jgi:TrmH family RNA methyltransferase
MITSTSNQNIKLVRSLLQDKRTREEKGLFVVEGVRMAEEILASGIEPELILYSSALSEKGKQVLAVLSESAKNNLEVEVSLLDRVSDTGTSQGILVVASKPNNPIPDQLDFILVLDQINNPGNLGTILRTAHACGVEGVFLTPNSADIYNPKVVRAGMGAHFKMPIQIKSPLEILEFCKNGTDPAFTLLASVVDGGTSCWDMNLQQPICLIIGNESIGISSELTTMATEQIHIPMQSNAESLNAAIAASILIYEVLRQRSTK